MHKLPMNVFKFHYDLKLLEISKSYKYHFDSTELWTHKQTTVCDRS